MRARCLLSRGLQLQPPPPELPQAAQGTAPFPQNGTFMCTTSFGLEGRGAVVRPLETPTS